MDYTCIDHSYVLKARYSIANAAASVPAPDNVLVNAHSTDENTRQNYRRVQAR